jgi:hypothetical protein
LILRPIEIVKRASGLAHLPNVIWSVAAHGSVAPDMRAATTRAFVA